MDVGLSRHPLSGYFIVGFRHLRLLFTSEALITSVVEVRMQSCPPTVSYCHWIHYGIKIIWPTTLNVSFSYLILLYDWT